MLNAQLMSQKKSAHVSDDFFQNSSTDVDFFLGQTYQRVFNRLPGTAGRSLPERLSNFGQINSENPAVVGIIPPLHNVFPLQDIQNPRHIGTIPVGTQRQLILLESILLPKVTQYTELLRRNRKVFGFHQFAQMPEHGGMRYAKKPAKRGFKLKRILHNC